MADLPKLSNKEYKKAANIINKNGLDVIHVVRIKENNHFFANLEDAAWNAERYNVDEYHSYKAEDILKAAKSGKGDDHKKSDNDEGNQGGNEPKKGGFGFGGKKG